MTNRGLRNNPRFNKIQPYHTFCIRFIHLFFLRQVANPLWLVYPISLLVFRIESPRERDSFIHYKSLSKLLFCRVTRTDVRALIERTSYIEEAKISSSTKDHPSTSVALPSLLSKENAISFDLPGITPEELRDKEVRNKEFKATLDEYVTKKIRRV